MADVEMKTYLLETKKGRRRITVPATWKVTFGPLVPGERGGNGCLALRFYEGTSNNQRAIFTDVTSFRDLSIAYEEEVTKAKQEAFYRDTPSGRKAMQAEVKVREWRDPDAREDEQSDMNFLQIEAHNDDDE